MKKKPVILVVDDEERNLRLMEALLTPMGYEISLAQSGMQAFEMVVANPPDVILLDIMMPKIDGFEVARRMKGDERTCMIPIVMVTNLADVEDRVKALRAGADDFLSKPVDKLELSARVGSLVKVKAFNDHMRNHREKLEAEVGERTRQLQEAFKKIKEASRETIHRLSRAAEFKDKDTVGHLFRVSNYAALIARKIGLGEKTVESILLAAPMHDIGKIGVPDHILRKPGKLAPEEWEIMKRHTVFGAKILEGSKVGFIRLAEVIAMTHHEKWDGTGYPRKLAGRKIPLVGRIMAIADVFDALTTRRPYKEAFPVEKSFEIIRQGRGSHFDPELVDVFISVAEKVFEIREEYADDKTDREIKSGSVGL